MNNLTESLSTLPSFSNIKLSMLDISLSIPQVRIKIGAMSIYSTTLPRVRISAFSSCNEKYNQPYQISNFRGAESALMRWSSICVLVPPVCFVICFSITPRPTWAITANNNSTPVIWIGVIFWRNSFIRGILTD